MKKFVHPCLAGVFLFTLGGCQNIPSFKIDTGQKIFNAPSYLGKELPSAFLSRPHGTHEDNGNRFRGYHSSKRHWHF